MRSVIHPSDGDSSRGMRWHEHRATIFAVAFWRSGRRDCQPSLLLPGSGIEISTALALIANARQDQLTAAKQARPGESSAQEWHYFDPALGAQK